MSCPYLHKTSSVTITTTDSDSGATSILLLTFTDSATAADRDHFCFIVCQNLPAGASTLPVYAVVNGANVPVWNKFGDPAKGSELLTRTRYTGFYGATTSTHVIATNLPKSVVTSCDLQCN